MDCLMLMPKTELIADSKASFSNYFLIELTDFINRPSVIAISFDSVSFDSIRCDSIS